MILTIEAANANELRSKVIEAAKVFGYEPAQLEYTFSEAGHISGVQPVEQKTEAKAEKKTRPVDKPKKVKAEAASEREAAPIPEAVVEAVVNAKVTVEDIRKSLGDYQGKFGTEKARDLLVKFEAKRISELKEDQYPAFIKACEV